MPQADGAVYTREQLTGFYSERNPEKLQVIDQLLENSTDTLVEALRQVYGDEAPVPVKCWQITRAQMVAFYKHHGAEAKIAGIDRILQHYTAAELMAALTQTYGNAPRPAHS